MTLLLQGASLQDVTTDLMRQLGISGMEELDALGIAKRMASDAEQFTAYSRIAADAWIESPKMLTNEQRERIAAARVELERAFDCFQILLKLGKDSGQFENLAEGYVNCIRVLKEDNLKFYVLQYYEDFIKLALERGELHAAATLYQEAAEYALKTGLPYDRRYQAKSGDTWVRCADRYAEQGLPVEMVENADLAAAQQFSAVGDYGAVRKVFEKLATLDLSERQKARFDAIARRYGGEAYAALKRKYDPGGAFPTLYEKCVLRR